MIHKFKCFEIDVFEQSNVAEEEQFAAVVWYAGQVGTTVTAPDEERALSLAQEWVEDEGFEWLGFE